MKVFSLAVVIICLVGAASAQTIFRTPESAAQTLYSAWRARNKAKAKSASTESTVEKLFDVRRRPMKFKGCEKREEGDYECIYEDAKNDITMAMLTHVTRRGFVIKTVSFSSEAL